MVVKWLFEDPVTMESYTFDINPNTGGSPAYEKNTLYKNTCAPDGKVVIAEGLDNPQKLSFSGVLLFQEQYDAFVTWWDKRYQVYITDDLGRQFSVEIDTFTPTRERAVHYPWKHSYSVDATIVEWL